MSTETTVRLEAHDEKGKSSISNTNSNGRRRKIIGLGLIGLGAALEIVPTGATQILGLPFILSGAAVVSRGKRLYFTPLGDIDTRTRTT